MDPKMMTPDERQRTLRFSREYDYCTAASIGAFTNAVVDFENSTLTIPGVGAAALNNLNVKYPKQISIRATNAMTIRWKDVNADAEPVLANTIKTFTVEAQLMYITITAAPTTFEFWLYGEH